MAHADDLERHIEDTQRELQDALTRLKGYAELQSGLNTANVAVDEGAQALSTLAGRLDELTQGLNNALREFVNAVDAMRAASPDALSRNLETAMGAVNNAAAQPATIRIRCNMLFPSIPDLTLH